MAKKVVKRAPAALQITAGEILEYVQCVNAEKAAKEVRSKIRERFVSLFADGATCETTGPFLVTLSAHEQISVDWKRETIKLLQKIHGTKWKQVHTDLVDSAPRVPVQRLDVVPNPAYTDNLVRDPED